jgi:hypothetical protein
LSENPLLTINERGGQYFMKWFVSGSLALMLSTVLAMPVSAEGQSVRSGWQQFKQDMKKGGREVKKTGKEVGHGIADGARKGGRAVKQLFTGDGGGSQGGNSK